MIAAIGCAGIAAFEGARVGVFPAHHGYRDSRHRTKKRPLKRAFSGSKTTTGQRTTAICSRLPPL
jgi:hypothetical protein